MNRTRLLFIGLLTMLMLGAFAAHAGQPSQPIRRLAM